MNLPSVLHGDLQLCKEHDMMFHSAAFVSLIYLMFPSFISSPLFIHHGGLRCCIVTRGNESPRRLGRAAVTAAAWGPYYCLVSFTCSPLETERV